MRTEGEVGLGVVGMGRVGLALARNGHDNESGYAARLSDLANYMINF